MFEYRLVHNKFYYLSSVSEERWTGKYVSSMRQIQKSKFSKPILEPGSPTKNQYMDHALGKRWKKYYFSG
jgi:hypothetical protein